NVRSRSAARNAALSVRSSRNAVNRARANGWSTTCTCMTDDLSRVDGRIRRNHRAPTARPTSHARRYRRHSLVWRDHLRPGLGYPWGGYRFVCRWSGDHHRGIWSCGQPIRRGTGRGRRGPGERSGRDRRSHDVIGHRDNGGRNQLRRRRTALPGRDHTSRGVEVASALVTSLAAPLHDLQAGVGTGVFTGDDPAVMLRDASRVLSDVASSAVSTAGQMGAVWSGAAAEAATQVISTAFTTVAEFATHALGMANRVGAASEAVARAKARLQRIIDDFETTARALEPGLPATAGAIADAARRALEDATLAVGELESELDGHASAVSQPASASAPMTA